MARKTQEMSQVEGSRSGSPFWSPPPSKFKRSTAASQSGNSPKVIGASYSHADILKFDTLSLGGGSSQSRTSPSASRTAHDQSSRSTGAPGTPPRKTYTGFLSATNGDWDLGNEHEDEDFGYDEDEDEFGLPSISSMRRKGQRKANKKPPDPGGQSKNGGGGSGMQGFGGSGYKFDTGDSGDIGDERGVPNYPTAIKSEGKILRPQYKEILRDPANALHLIDHPRMPQGASAKEMEAFSARIARIDKFKRLLQSTTIPLSELRDNAWNGIPSEVRHMTWQLLLGYLPTNSERRVATLERKRKEYLDGVRQAFDRGPEAESTVTTGTNSTPINPVVSKGRGRGLDEAIWHQISIDVPRTNPHIQLYSFEATQRSLERILYVWAIRHPASGYVQGINDLATPFWQVFLGTYITNPDVETGMDPGQLPKAVLDAVEADTFWSLTKLLDGIQDNYIIHQPGIQRQVASLRDLTTRIDASLAQHLEAEGVEFMQFSFRWMNCLLMREVSIQNVIRMWDTYMAEEQGFSQFHLYVCAAFLVKWSADLMKKDFQEVMMFLQALPTRSWTEKDIELLLSEAFIWQNLFHNSKAHLKGINGAPQMMLGS